AGHEQGTEAMSLSVRQIYLYPRQSRFSNPPGVRAAVSLHSHSECSRETLEFLPRIAKSIPVVAGFYKRSLQEYQRQNGHPINFGDWYSRPPITAEGVVDSERAQIEQRLDLPGWVSLTDHDTIEGPLGLRAGGRTDTPISFEWSVPFGRSLFHLGVHGVAPDAIDATMRALTAYTKGSRPSDNRQLGELLDLLGECPETFVVLNHPCWDLVRAGQLQHDSALLAFLRAH